MARNRALFAIFLVCYCSLGETRYLNPPIEVKGEWAVWEKCPGDNYVNGISVRWNADSSLGALRFHCASIGQSKSEGSYVLNVAKTEIGLGKWTDPVFCERGVAIGVQLLEQTVEETTTTSNVALICSDEMVLTNKHQGVTGSWSNPNRCNFQEAICATQAEVATNGDVTSLVTLRFDCCAIAHPAQTCKATDTLEKIAECDNEQGAVTPKTCTYSKKIGLSFNNVQEEERSIYEDLGFDLPSAVPYLAAQPDFDPKQGQISFDLETTSKELLSAEPGTKLTLEQISGTCGFYTVRTKFVKVITHKMASAEDKFFEGDAMQGDEGWSDEFSSNEVDTTQESPKNDKKPDSDESAEKSKNVVTSAEVETKNDSSDHEDNKHEDNDDGSNIKEAEHPEKTVEPEKTDEIVPESLPHEFDEVSNTEVTNPPLPEVNPEIETKLDVEPEVAAAMSPPNHDLDNEPVTKEEADEWDKTEEHQPTVAEAKDVEISNAAEGSSEPIVVNDDHLVVPVEVTVPEVTDLETNESKLADVQKPEESPEIQDDPVIAHDVQPEQPITHDDQTSDVDVLHHEASHIPAAQSEELHAADVPITEQSATAPEHSEDGVEQPEHSVVLDNQVSNDDHHNGDTEPSNTADVLVAEDSTKGPDHQEDPVDQPEHPVILDNQLSNDDHQNGDTEQSNTVDVLVTETEDGIKAPDHPEDPVDQPEHAVVLDNQLSNDDHQHGDTEQSNTGDVLVTDDSTKAADHPEDPLEQPEHPVVLHNQLSNDDHQNGDSEQSNTADVLVTETEDGIKAADHPEDHVDQTEHPMVPDDQLSDDHQNGEIELPNTADVLVAEDSTKAPDHSENHVDETEHPIVHGDEPSHDDHWNDDTDTGHANPELTESATSTAVAPEAIVLHSNPVSDVLASDHEVSPKDETNEIEVLTPLSGSAELGNLRKEDTSGKNENDEDTSHVETPIVHDIIPLSGNDKVHHDDAADEFGNFDDVEPKVVLNVNDPSTNDNNLSPMIARIEADPQAKRAFDFLPSEIPPVDLSSIAGKARELGDSFTVEASKVMDEVKATPLFQEGQKKVEETLKSLGDSFNVEEASKVMNEVKGTPLFQEGQKVEETLKSLGDSFTVEEASKVMNEVKATPIFQEGQKKVEETLKSLGDSFTIEEASKVMNEVKATPIFQEGQKKVEETLKNLVESGIKTSSAVLDGSKKADYIENKRAPADIAADETKTDEAITKAGGFVGYIVGGMILCVVVIVIVIFIIERRGKSSGRQDPLKKDEYKAEANPAPVPLLTTQNIDEINRS